jgi:hypothetical protein
MLAHHARSAFVEPLCFAGVAAWERIGSHSSSKEKSEKNLLWRDPQLVQKDERNPGKIPFDVIISG